MAERYAPVSLIFCGKRMLFCGKECEKFHLRGRNPSSPLRFALETNPLADEASGSGDSRKTVAKTSFDIRDRTRPTVVAEKSG